MSLFKFSVINAILATSSKTTAFETALLGFSPQENGPWLSTIIPGTLKESIFLLSKVSIITKPVFLSYSVFISSSVNFLVQGIGP